MIISFVAPLQIGTVEVNHPGYFSARRYLHFWVVFIARQHALVGALLGAYECGRLVTPQGILVTKGTSVDAADLGGLPAHDTYVRLPGCCGEGSGLDEL